MIDKEIWADIPGYVGLYQISNFGRVKAIATIRPSGKHKETRKKEKILSPQNYLRYFGATLYKNGIAKQCLIHRIVAKVFIPNPENKPYVNHLNSNGFDNRVCNLEWCTPIQNSKHSIMMGNKPMGATHLQSKILLDTRTGIFYECVRDAAFAYGVSRTHITNMMTGHRKNKTGLVYV